MAPADRGLAAPDVVAEAAARALAALDGLPDGAALLRPRRDDAGVVVDLVYAYANAARRQGGRLPAPVAARPRAARVAAGVSRRALRVARGVLAGGEPLHAEIDYREAFHRPPEVLRALRDQRVEARRRAARRLRRPRRARDGAHAPSERYRAVLDATSDWVSIADRDLNLIYINAGGRAMVGMERGRGHSPAADRRVLAEVGARPRAPRGARGARAQGVWRGDLARLHRDGHEIPVSQVIVARTDDDGEVDFYATIARDMTRERAPRRRCARARSASASPSSRRRSAFALLDLQGRYLQVNDAYCRTVRRSREELLGATPGGDHPSRGHRRLRPGVNGSWPARCEEYSFEKRYLTRRRRHHLGGAQRDGLPRRRRQAAVAHRHDPGRRRAARRADAAAQHAHAAARDRRRPLAARYLPGSPETEVCGDWYDVIPLPDGRVGIVDRRRRRPRP